MRKVVTVFILLTFLPMNSFAQQGGKQDIFNESIKDFSIVIGSGLGGAVLGLSTLSFVDEPKDHLKNILVGGSIGIILGVGIVAYMQANRSQKMYKSNTHLFREDSPDFKTVMRKNWHVESFQSNNFYSAESPSFLSLQTSF